MYCFFGGKFFKRTPVQFFVKSVARGNAVQISLNFPAKRLSIYRKKNLQHVFNDLKDFQLNCPRYVIYFAKHFPEFVYVIRYFRLARSFSKREMVKPARRDIKLINCINSRKFIQRTRRCWETLLLINFPTWIMLLMTKNPGDLFISLHSSKKMHTKKIASSHKSTRCFNVYCKDCIGLLTIL